MAKKPFKMKSAAYGGPMRRNFPSAFPKLDVKVVTPDEEGKLKETTYTGPDAYSKGKDLEKAKDRAFAAGTAGTEEERQSPEGKKIAKDRATRIEYTGADAYKRINETNWNYPGGSKDKAKAQAVVAAGGSYTQ